jgi:hypothetical protein
MNKRMHAKFQNNKNNCSKTNIFKDISLCNNMKLTEKYKCLKYVKITGYF